MFQRLFVFLLRYLVETITIAALYVGLAQLGFALALPPGNVTALWLPSGLALTAALLGYHASLGVWLGSFLVNVNTLSGSPALAVAAAIASGSTLQMLVCASLVRRFVAADSGKVMLTPATARGILLFIGVTALGALAASTIGVTSLCLAGFAPWNNFFTLWWTWWLGDYAGILTVAPPLIVLGLRLRKQEVAEPIFFPLASVWLGLSLLVFFLVWQAEEQSLKAKLRTETDGVTHDIRQSIDRGVAQLAAIKALYAASNAQVNRKEFLAFVTPLLQDNPTIQALSWVPRITQADRAPYEQAGQREGLASFQIFERNAAGQNIPAAQRSEYFSVYFIEPFKGNEAALGFDIGSNPIRLEAINRARDSGQAAATAPITLVQETGQQKGILVLVPVYHSAVTNTPAETQRSNLLGIASGVFRMGDMVQDALQARASHNVELYLFDHPSQGNTQLLAFYSCAAKVDQTAQSIAPNLNELQTGPYDSLSFDIGGRNWLAIVRACPNYLNNERGWGPWGVLLIGLVLSGLVIAYTEIRQRAESALRSSELTTRLIMDTTPDAIIVSDAKGRIVRANAQTEKIFGYQQNELLGAPTEILLPERYQIRHQQYHSESNTRPYPHQMDESLELYGRHQDGHEFPVDIMLSLLEMAEGHFSMATIRDISERKRVELTLAESEQTYRALFEHANDAIFLISLDGFHLKVNQKAADLLGYTKDELIGMTISDVVAAGEYPDAESKRDALLAGQHLLPYERLFRKKDGHIFPVEINISLVRDAEGKPKYLQSIVRDITERKNALEQIRQLNATLEQRVVERTTELEKEIAERKRTQTALQRSNDQLQLSVFELEWRNRQMTLLSELIELLESCRNAEEAYQAMTRQLPRLLPGEPGALYMISNLRDTVELVAHWDGFPDAMATFAPMDCWALRRGRIHVMESPLSDMVCKHIEQYGTTSEPYLCLPMVAHGETLGVLHLRYTPSEGGLAPTKEQLLLNLAEQIGLVLANLRLRETLHSQSVHDPLTGLFNRRYMEETLERELRRAERAGRPLAVAMLDLDYFKRFNDTFGHAAGDTALRALSTLLKNKMRASDTVCRYGGEEFVVIFSETTLAIARQRMESLREEAKQLVLEQDGRSLGQLTLSVGVAVAPEHGLVTDTLLKAADDALYRAKQLGRDRVITAPTETGE